MMAQYISRLSKEKFSEYLKLGIALKITKEGLYGIVDKETNNFHQYILQNILGKQPCSECQVENILECPTTGFCSPKHCSFHSSSSRQPRQCPNGSCNIIRDIIREHFRYYNQGKLEPSWSNTNAQLWTKNPFQVMKCYLPRNEYQEIGTIEDVDLNGLINVIINNKMFDKYLSDDFNKKDNFYIKVLEIEKNYRNCDSLTISDWLFTAHLKDMINLLTGTTPLLHDQGAQQAVAKLEKIKSDTLIVNTQSITEVLSELILSITKEDGDKEKQRGKSKKRSSQKITTRGTLRLNVASELCNIFSRDHRNMRICQLESIISKHNGTIHELKESIKKLKMPENKETDSGVTQRKRIKHEAYDTAMQSSFSEKSYDELKTELKHDLVQFYLERHNTLPLSPLIQGNKASLLEFYVQPAITVVDLNKGLFDRKEHLTYKDVDALEDIFQKRNDKLCRNIFLTASPGAGKTTFLKHLALTWCQAQTKDHTYLSRDEKHMQQFDFVFFISLREARHECELDAMLKTLVISQLDQEYSYTDTFLQEILHKEHCLVLMDGLDEWQHPNLSITACHLGRSDFPHTKVRPKCINLTTSRPWTLNSVRNCSYLIDQRLEVQGLGRESSKMLVDKVLCHLTGYKKISSQTEQEKQKQFFEMLSSKRLRKFESNPVILMQLLGLWLEGTDPGESQCEIYSNMLELLFRRAEMAKRYRTKGKHQKSLPSCFSRKTHCKRNAKLLVSLGKLAFATLFGADGESVYVFDRFLANGHMHDRDIHRSLEVGILSQTDMHRKITTDNIQLSFLHKTFQEFFAALSIAAKPEIIREVKTKLSHSNETVHKSLQLETLLVFLSGFAPEITSDLTSWLGKETAKDGVTKEYRETIGTMFLESRLPMNDYCSMITNCVMESICNGHTQLTPFHLEDIFVDDQCMDMKYACALKSVIEMNRSHIKSLSIHVMQTIDKDNTNRILHELSIQHIRNLQKLFVWGNIPRVHLQSLLQLSKYTAKCLELWGMQLFSEDIAIISAMNSIESLSFLSILVTHSVLEEFIKHFRTRKTLTQLCLQDIECTDHYEDCSEFSLNLPDQSRLVLLLLDKVNFASIHFNSERLKMCIVEWLHVPGSIKSLLECLANSETLERFDYDGKLCLEDTEALVETISSMPNVRYLRLRNIDLSKSPLDLCRLQNLRTVYFSNVSIESDLLQKIADHFRGLTSSVTFCMENFEVTSQETYHQVKENLRSSEEFEILLDIETGFKQLQIKYTPSNKTHNIAHTSDQGNSDWEQCLCKDTAFASKVAERLIRSRNFPEQQALNNICQRFGRKEKLLKTLCTELGASIKSKSEKIVQVIPSYYKESDQSEKIIFVICTNAALSRAEKETIKEYSHKIRPIGEYSLEGQEVVQNKLFMEQNLKLKELENLKICINKHADMLLSKHRQLSIIAPSAWRSKFYGTSKAKIIREPCIVLFVHTKNCIPIDEEPFDEDYEGIPIDVREGGFITQPDIPYNGELIDDLKMGCNIGSVMDRNRFGSLGGFIEHPTYGLCGLTCAHVLLKDQWMKDLKRIGSMKWPVFHPFEGVTHPSGTENVIGRLVQAVCTKGCAEQSGMEVALFRIDRHRPNSGMFYGIDDMRFDGGKSNEASVIDDVTVVKVGSKTHKTTGQFIMNIPAITVRTSEFNLTNESYALTLHNQLEVMSFGWVLHGNRFSERGDSGSLVFMKRSAEDNEYICVGMVEGQTTYGTSIVTPITPILQAFGVGSFKNFETANLSKDLKNVETKITDRIQSLESQIEQSFSVVMNELREMRSRMLP